MTRAQKEAGLKELAERADRGEPQAIEPRQEAVTARFQGLNDLLLAIDGATTKDELLERLAHARQPRNTLAQVLAESFGIGPTAALILFSEAALCGDPNFECEAEALLAMDPRGELQAMLAVQMRGLHKAAMRELRSGSSEDTREVRDSRCNRATKYSQAFRTNAELFSRLKGQIQQQRIVVERLDVNSGGQAIVAASVGGGGRETK
jgi:hypothetical protein